MPDLGLDLARALVAVPGFRVMNGSLWQNEDGETRLVVCGDRDFAWTFVRDGDDVVREFSEEHARAVWTNYGPWLPVLDDPATAGCLAELLDDDWSVHFDPHDRRYRATRRWGGAPDCRGATRGEAIARAIVAAGRCAGGGE